MCIIVPNFAKVGQNESEISPIFKFSRWRPSAILIFKSWKLQLPVRFGSPICVITQNFAKIGRTFRRYGHLLFSRWRPSAILDLFYACWAHPRRVLGGLCDCAKFGCNRCRNFDSMQILICCTLSLKMPIHAPQNRVFWGILPQDGEQYERNPKRHILWRKHVVWRIDRQNWFTCVGSARAEEWRKKLKN